MTRNAPEELYQADMDELHDLSDLVLGVLADLAPHDAVRLIEGWRETPQEDE